MKRMSSGMKRASFSKKSSNKIDVKAAPAPAKPDEMLQAATTEQEVTAAELKAEAPGSAPAPVDPEVNSIASKLVDNAVTEALAETATAIAAPAVAAVVAVKKAASKVDLQAYQQTALAKAKEARAASPAKQLLMLAAALLLVYIGWTVLFAATEEAVEEVSTKAPLMLLGKEIKVPTIKLPAVKIPEIKIKLPNLKKAPVAA